MLVSRIYLKEGILSSTTQLMTVHITRFAPWKPCNDVYNLFLVPCMRHETGPWHTTLTPFSRMSNNIMYCWPRHVTMSSSSCSLQSHSSDLTYFTTVWDQCLGTKDARFSCCTGHNTCKSGQIIIPRPLTYFIFIDGIHSLFLSL